MVTLYKLVYLIFKVRALILVNVVLRTKIAKQYECICDVTYLRKRGIFLMLKLVHAKLDLLK